MQWRLGKAPSRVEDLRSGSGFNRRQGSLSLIMVSTSDAIEANDIVSDASLSLPCMTRCVNQP